MIYVHVKGKQKEIEIEKTDRLLGLTICDNSNGLCLIKKIKDGSVIDKIKFSVNVSTRKKICIFFIDYFLNFLWNFLNYPKMF